MWKRWLIVLAVMVVVLVASGAGVVYAYDAARVDRIADGVYIGPVDVSGLSPQGARLALRQQLIPKLNRPVQTVYKRRNFTITPAQAHLRVDLNATVDQALEISRDGTVLGRAYRDVRGRSLDVRLPMSVTYSPGAVRAFATRVARAVREEPRNARLVPSFASLRKVPSRDGVAVRKRLFEGTVGAQLVTPDASHAIEVPTRAVKPQVTTRGLARKYPYFVTISRWTKELKLFRHLRRVKTYRIAVGQIGYDTPGGLYRVETKAINPAWHVPDSPWTGDLAGRIIPGGAPDNPLKARWMGFYDGAGIHGTDAIYSLGSAASHGCIRMSISDVIELYDIVPIYTPIFIA